MKIYVKKSWCGICFFLKQIWKILTIFMNCSTISTIMEQAATGGGFDNLMNRNINAQSDTNPQHHV